MQVVVRCPFCQETVEEQARNCPHCAGKLTRAKFRFMSVLLYGILGMAIAFIFSLIIVPLSVIGILIALFARERLHQVNFENPSDGPSTSTHKRVVDIPDSN